MKATFWLEEALNCVKEDGEAQGQEEDAVVQGTQQLGALPAIGQCWLPFRL